MPPKKCKKKGKPALGDWSDDDAVPDPLQGGTADAEQQAEPAAEQQAPQQQPRPKKAKGKKKGKKLDWSDDEDVPAAPSTGVEDAAAYEEPPRRSSSGGSRGAAGFAALPSEGEDAADEAEAPAAIGTDAGSESDDGSDEVGCVASASHRMRRYMPFTSVKLP